MAVDEFLTLLDRLHLGKEYRPESVAVLYRGSGSQREFLITQSAKFPTVWAPLQEGIEQGEFLELALARGLKEELGITNFQRDVVDVIPLYYEATLNYEVTRSNNRGYARGKKYFCSLGKYIGDGNFTLDSAEVKEAKWMTYDISLQYFVLGRPEKLILSKAMLDEAVDILDAIRR